MTTTITPAEQAVWNRLTPELNAKLDAATEAILDVMLALHGESDDAAWREGILDAASEAVGQVAVTPDRFGLDLPSEASERYWMRRYAAHS